MKNFKKALVAVVTLSLFACSEAPKQDTSVTTTQTTPSPLGKASSIDSEKMITDALQGAWDIAKGERVIVNGANLIYYKGRELNGMPRTYTYIKSTDAEKCGEIPQAYNTVGGIGMIKVSDSKRSNCWLITSIDSTQMSFIEMNPDGKSTTWIKAK